MKYHNELSFFENLLLLFKHKTKIIKVGDIGIYQDIISVNTYNDGTNKIECKFSVKVKATGVFEKLVEIEIVGVFNTNNCDEHLDKMISSSIPKFVHPRYIKWELK